MLTDAQRAAASEHYALVKQRTKARADLRTAEAMNRDTTAIRAYIARLSTDIERAKARAKGV